MTDTKEPRSATFARKVRDLRVEHDWSQTKLGALVGLGQSRIAAIEATGSVTLDQAQDIADALGVPLEVLIYDRLPGSSDARIRQEQRLLQLYNAVDAAREEVVRISAEIRAEIPGKLPRGVIVTGDRVILPETGE
jgi:transcriptional regulator with XRE-family HTH domain